MVRISAILLAAGLWLTLSACTEPTVAVDAGATVAEVRDFQTIKDDARIKLQVAGDFLDDQAGLFKNVNVDVYESSVMLTGVVLTGADKLRAVEIVQSVEGVRTVLDEIQVTTDGNFQQVLVGHESFLLTGAAAAARLQPPAASRTAGFSV